MTIRLLLVSVEGTIASQGTMLNAIAAELAQLARELHAQGVRVALWSNRSWTHQSGIPLNTHLSNLAGVPIEIHGARNDGTPARGFGNSAAPILAKYGVARHETVLVGGMREDMLAGVNNGLLLIRPNWYGANINYGFPVEKVDELRRFLLVFALRQHPIFWRIQSGSLDAAAAGPFSTRLAAYAEFGDAAKLAAKHGMGRKDFWFYFIVASIYFGNLIHDVDYICSYPSHGTGAPSAIKQEVNETLTRLGNCFRKPYYHDLLLRHAQAVKSQHIPAANRTFLAQLNTIRINAHPHKNLGKAPKGAIKLQGRKVLLVDDFCTSGRSLESARAYLEAAGATTRSFSWLKTINTSYMELAGLPTFNPFHPNTFTAEPASTPIPYAQGIVDDEAPDEINRILRQYVMWK